jgi:hypothetical protein
MKKFGIVLLVLAVGAAVAAYFAPAKPQPSFVPKEETR